jgi:Ran GTPase-activating protein 1
MVNFLTHNHHFSVLKLNNNGLGVTGGQIVANALLAAAEELETQGKQSKLRTVICGRNRLEDGSAPYWAKAYAAHKNLEEVRMFQNGIRMDGIVALAKGLASCPNLKVLDFQDNTATVPGSRGIAASLSSWPHLEILNLSDCLLKPRGGYLVLDALHKGNNVKLNTLQLQYCDLDRKALERLASALDSGALKNVAKLEINGNWADEEDECIDKIKKALEKNGHEDALDELDEMDPEGEDEDAEEEDEDAEDGDAEEQGAKSAVGSNTAETAAAAIAAPAASVAVAAGITAGAASNVSDTIDDKLQNLDLGGDAKEVSTSNEPTSASKASEQEQNTSDAVVEADKEPIDVTMAPAVAPMDTAVVPETEHTTATASTQNQEKENENIAIIAPAATAGGVAALAGAGVAALGSSSANVGRAETVTQVDSTTGSIVAGAPSVADKKAASTAAEVADSAAEVPEEKEAAENAAEVAASAQEVPDAKQAAETADEVDEVAKQVPERAAGTQLPAGAEIGKAADASSAVAAEKTITPTSAIASNRHPQQQGSVDLSGELYGDENQARSPRLQTQSLSAETSDAAATIGQQSSQTAQPEQQKKRGFRAAIGAIRELLR